MPLTVELATSDNVNTLLDTVGVDYALAIALADTIISEDLASSGLSVQRLDNIKLFLAAHYATLSVEKGGLNKMTVGSASETYNGISDKYTGLNSTRFGQAALTLDTSGGLLIQVQSTLQRAEFRVI